MCIPTLQNNTHWNNTHWNSVVSVGTITILGMNSSYAINKHIFNNPRICIQIIDLLPPRNLNKFYGMERPVLWIMNLFSVICWAAQSVGHNADNYPQTA